NEQRVLRGDPVRGQALEERPERLVVVLRLGDVAGAAGAERGGRAVTGGHAGDVLVAVNVGDVAAGDGDAGFLHVGEVGERLGGVDGAEAGEARLVVKERTVDLVAVEVHQVAGGVGDLEPVARHVRRAPAELGSDVPVPEQPLEAGVATRLVGQQVGGGGGAGRRLAELYPLGVSAESAALRAVHVDADVVRHLLVLEAVRVGGELLRLGRAGPEHLGDVNRGVLQLHIRRPDVTGVASSAGVGHPGGGGDRVGRGGGLRGGRRGGRVDHGRVRVVPRSGGRGGVEDRVGPVREGARRVCGAVGVEGPVGVIHPRHPVPVPVQP